MLKHKLVDFIIQFMEEVDKEISEMKLFVCTLDDCFDIMRTPILICQRCPVERKSSIRSRIFLDTGKFPCQGKLLGYS